MTKVSELHREWSKDPEYREAYDRLEPEFALARMLIEARRRAALTQAELAERMETTQSVVARLESGRIHPSTRTLEKDRPRHGHPASDQFRSGVMRPQAPRHRRRGQVLVWTGRNPTDSQRSVPNLDTSQLTNDGESALGAT